MSAPAQPVFVSSAVAVRIMGDSAVAGGGDIPVIQADREIIPYNAPASLHQIHRHGGVAANGNNNNGDAAFETCPICLDDVVPTNHHQHHNSPPGVQISFCQHVFHQHCLIQSLQHDANCPVCRINVGECQGRCPSGTMRITRLVNTRCPGFEGSGDSTIQIEYNIPGGKQRSYHENPGVRYHGTSRTAYLPDTREGRMTLARLKYAWMHGLIFTVGTSLTSHIPNSVTWTSIHHKTSLQGGAHGFPDPNYLTNVNASLDAHNVPPIVAPSSSPSAYDLSTGSGDGDEILHYVAPSNLRPRIPEGALKPYTGPPPTMAQQRHNQNFALPQGHSPSGSMTIEVRNDRVCPGYKNSGGAAAGVIKIEYFIPQSIQRPYHPNPGAPFPETTRIAYLPLNEDGRQLLVRFKYAWKHGLVFAIGTSLTTGQPDVVVWSGLVPHKTSLRRGDPFGFPDPTYVQTCNAHLDAVGVPPADLIV